MFQVSSSKNFPEITAEANLGGCGNTWVHGSGHPQQQGRVGTAGCGSGGGDKRASGAAPGAAGRRRKRGRKRWRRRRGKKRWRRRRGKER